MECSKVVLNSHRMLKKPSKRSWCSCKNIVLSLIISIILLQVINFSKYGISAGNLTNLIFLRANFVFFRRFSIHVLLLFSFSRKKDIFHSPSQAIQQHYCDVFQSKNWILIYRRTCLLIFRLILLFWTFVVSFFVSISILYNITALLSRYYIDSKQARPPTLEDKKTLLMNLLKCNFHDPRIKKMIFSNR